MAFRHGAGNGGHNGFRNGNRQGRREARGTFRPTLHTRRILSGSRARRARRQTVVRCASRHRTRQSHFRQTTRRGLPTTRIYSPDIRRDLPIPRHKHGRGIRTNLRIPPRRDVRKIPPSSKTGSRCNRHIGALGILRIHRRDGHALAADVCMHPRRVILPATRAQRKLSRLCCGITLDCLPIMYLSTRTCLLVGARCAPTKYIRHL